MDFLISIIVGLAGHLALYDICHTLPFPDLASHAVGVLIAYPVARHNFHRKGDFDFAFLVIFLGVGIGTFIGRVLRGTVLEKS